MRLTYKLLIAVAFMSLAGCVVVPAGAPAGLYVGPQIVAPTAYVGVSPYYSWYGPRYYYGRRW